MSTFQQELQALRAEIDDVDHELLQILKRRVEISTAIGRLKLANGRGIVDAAREGEMVAARALAGSSIGLPEGLDLGTVQDPVEGLCGDLARALMRGGRVAAGRNILQVFYSSE